MPKVKYVLCVIINWTNQQLQNIQTDLIIFASLTLGLLLQVLREAPSRMAAPEGSSVEVLTVSLNSLRSLRSTVTQFLKALADGPKYEQDQEGEGDLQEVAAKAMIEIRNKLRYDVNDYVSMKKKEVVKISGISHLRGGHTRVLSTCVLCVL